MAPMVAVNDGGDLDFYHVGGVLRLTLVGLKPNTYNKIRVTFDGMTYVTGTYTVSNAGTSSATTTVSSGSHNYVEFTKTNTDWDAITTLNIPLPSGDYSDCTRITINAYFKTGGSSSWYKTIPWLSLGRARGKKEGTLNGLDLSKYNHFTGAFAQPQETANTYIVNANRSADIRFVLPLFYGNAVVGDEDNISTAAPAKVNANDGVFVNAYDVAISSGNIKSDIEDAGYMLNTSGGKLIWSTASSTNKALLSVEPTIPIIDGIGYLVFTVPVDGLQEGSALIGVLKDGSTDEYVWAWHIWFVNNGRLSTEEYTNYQGNTIDFLDRSLGGRSGTSVIATYYQFGMPFPIPPSNGITDRNATLYDENGAYTFNNDSGNTITTLGKALSKPYLPRWSNAFFNTAAGAAQNFCNIWDATQTGTSDKAVVKTIYDPSPAGMTVPRYNAFTGFTTTGGNVSSGAPTNCNVVGSFYDGWELKKNSSDATGSFWAASGYRVDGSTPRYVRTYGDYWSACAVSSSNARYLSIGPSGINPQASSGRFMTCSIRPALIEN